MQHPELPELPERKKSFLFYFIFLSSLLRALQALQALQMVGIDVSALGSRGGRTLILGRGWIEGQKGGRRSAVGGRGLTVDG